MSEISLSQPVTKDLGAAVGGEGRAPTVAPLGRNADFASTVIPQRLTESPAQVRNWFLRSVGRDILKRAGIQKRLRFCGEKINFRERGVGVFQRPDRAVGRLSGVCVCGQSVVCPVCAPRIAAFRAAEIGEAYTRARDAGYEAHLDTFTMPHNAGNDLGDEIDIFGRAWRSFTGGRKSNFFRNGYLGNHTAREITHGVNGWHYHHHQLRYHKPGTHEKELAQAQWLGALHFVGRWTPAALEYAYDSGMVRDEQGATYTAKISTACTAAGNAIGREVALAGSKGRNIVTLLADHAAGCTTSGAIWLDGARAVIKRKVSSVRWTAGLRSTLGLSGDELSDEKIAEDKALPSDVYLGSLTTQQWRRIVNERLEYSLVRAAQQGRDAVNAMLEGMSVGELLEELPEARK